MGILNDLKAIFFASSSVAKSAGEKTGEYLSENADDILEKGKDLAENIGGTVLDKASSLKDTVLDKSNDIVQSTTEYFDTANDILDNDVVNTASNKAKEFGDKAAETGGKLVDKFGELSENVGEKLLNKKDELTDKYGDRVAAAKDSIVEKAGEVTNNMKQKLDETVANAEKWEAEQADKYQAGFPKEDFDAGGSFLEGTDDFFSKADKFADGDYSAAAEGRIDIGTNDNYEAGKDTIAKAAGFDDIDNDGDEIIDDAILDESDS